MVINLTINKNSIFFSITLFFIILILTTHTIIYVGYHITKQEQINLLINRYMETLHKVRIKYQTNTDLNTSNSFKVNAFYSNLDKDDFNKLLQEYDLVSSDISYTLLKKEGSLVSSDVSWELYLYNGYTYFYRDNKFDFLFLKDTVKVTDKTIYFVFLTLLLNSTFLLFYIFLINKLSPLKKLKVNILEFSKGNLNIDTSSKGKDEISEVSNEFNNAILEIKELTESRNLFLRNIMHELKTPITKGKLIGNLMQDEEHKTILKRVFERLEYLLHEFAKIEQITSKNIELNKKEYRIIDIIDQAIDILMISKKDLNFVLKSQLIINVDFYLFSLVLKNLIDNALKYGKSKVIIEVDKNYLAIKNEGEKLEKDFSQYIKPFNRNYETSSQSLGLGLYIVHNILRVHNLKLEYKHQNNQNTFYINFP